MEQDASTGFAKRVLQARLNAGARRGKTLTQTEVAEKLKVTQATVGRWESGDAEPDLATIKRLAKVLGVDPGDLAFGPPAEDGPVKRRKTGGG